VTRNPSQSKVQVRGKHEKEFFLGEKEKIAMKE